MEPAVTSPFGNRPASLMQPDAAPMPQVIPDIGGVAQITGQPAGTAALQSQQPVPDQVTAPASDQADPFSGLDSELGLDQAMSGLDAELGLQPEENPDAESVLPAPEGWDSAKEQIREAATRFRNAFTVTGKESLQVLKESGLFDDVRQKGETVQVKRKGRKGWEPFDRDKIELLGDAVDLSRDVFEGIVENAFRAAGTVGGAVGGGAPTAGVGAIPGGMAGAAAAGAAGAITAKNAGDMVADELLGIKRDPSRSAVAENALAGGFGAAFSLAGSALARRAAARAALKGEATKTIEHATKQVAETMDDIATAKQLLPEGFRMDPQQMVGAGQIPELDTTARELSTEQSFRNFRRQVGDSIKHAYDSVAKTLGAQAGKGANLADDFVLTSNDVRQVEGKMIGAFRDQAEQQLKGAKQPAPRLLQTIQFAKEALPTAAHAERQLGLMPDQAKHYMGELNRMESLLKRTNGQMRIDTAFALEKRLTQQINARMGNPNTRQLGIALIDLRNAVKDDALDMMETSFKQMGGPEGSNQLLNSFMQSKARYREIMDATKGLGKMLETDNLSKNELIGKLFEGKGSYKFAMNAKTLIDETNPQMWDNLAGEYFSKLKNDATNTVTNTVDWGSIAKKWSNLDPRLQKELMGSTGIDPAGMQALLKLGTRFQGASFDAVAKDSNKSMLKGVIRNLAIAYGGGATAKGGAMGSLIDGMGKDQAVTKWLKDGGMEEILKEMPGMKPERMQAARDWIANVQIRPAVKAVKQLNQTATRRRAEDE